MGLVHDQLRPDERLIIEAAKRESIDLMLFGTNQLALDVTTANDGIELADAFLQRHSASPWLYKNSYDESFKFWTAFERELLNNKSESKFASVTGCVTGAHAGDSLNSVPSNATLDIDIRIPPGVTTQELVFKIQNFTATYEHANPEVRIVINSKDECEAFLASDDSKAVSAFRWAIRSQFGKPVAFVKKTGTSDINLFAKKHNVPMLAYGPGDSSLDHTDNEHVSMTEYLNAIEVYASALSRFAELDLNVAQAHLR